jgi:hypothetical protein
MNFSPPGPFDMARGYHMIIRRRCGQIARVRTRRRRLLLKKAAQEAAKPPLAAANSSPPSPSFTHEYLNHEWKNELREKLETSPWKAIDAAIPY